MNQYNIWILNLWLAILIQFFSPHLMRGEIKNSNNSNNKEQSRRWSEIRSYVRNGQNIKALELLAAEQSRVLSEQERGLLHFSMGVLYYRMNDLDSAENHLNLSLKTDLKIKDYVNLHLGMIYYQKNDLERAKKEFNLLLSLDPDQGSRFEALFYLALIAQKENQFLTAKKHLVYLEKRQRNSYKYPRLLYELTRLELKAGNRSQMCSWARKIFSKYPSDPLIYDWNIDLHKSKVDDKQLGCISTLREQQIRIKNLQFAGYPDRARSEIEELQKRVNHKTQIHVDKILARFLVSEGLIEEAISLLIKYYDENKKDLEFLNILANAAIKAGEFDAAIAINDKIHQYYPQSKYGKKALFSSAFLSYQFQDYDGATLRFEKFSKKYGHSGLSRDAQWYLAWMQYLKGNYNLALEKFQKLGIDRGRRRQRNLLSKERVHYWTAVALLKNNRVHEARSRFVQLAKDPLYSYYSILSRYRLKEIKEENNKRNVAGVYNQGSPLQILDDPSNIFTPPLVVPDSLNIAQNSEEEESEESLHIGDINEDVNETSEVSEDGQSSQIVVDENETDKEDVLNRSLEGLQQLSHPRLSKRFERARDLAYYGFYNWANENLREIEMGTRQTKYLKALMTEYEMVESFNRSSYIGEIHFQPLRAKHGLQGIKYLWEHVYPRAFQIDVDESAQQSQIPQELIWSIMRAESQYKPETYSKVGAIGLMQLMPNTARQIARLMNMENFEVSQLNIPRTNIQMGSKYLGRLMKKFSNEIPLVAAGYNAGPHRVDSWLKSFGKLDMDEFIEHIPFVETKDYVKKVIRNYQIYSELYSNQNNSLSWLIEPVNVQCDGRPAPRETWEPF